MLSFHDWESFAYRINVPKSLVAASFDLEPKPPLVRAREWMATGYPAGGCLVLAGATGVGKSTAAVAALRASVTVDDTRMISEPRQFFHIPDVSRRLLFTTPELREEVLRGLTKTPFIVLDDLGAEFDKPGGLFHAFLDEIIWSREANWKATIVTTNLTGDELRARYYDRIHDRFRGDWGVVFECPGESLRPAMPKRVETPPPPRPEPGPSEYIDVSKVAALLKTRTR